MLWGCVAFGQLLYRQLRTQTDAPQRSSPARAIKLVGNCDSIRMRPTEKAAAKAAALNDPAAQIRAGRPLALRYSACAVEEPLSSGPGGSGCGLSSEEGLEPRPP